MSLGAAAALLGGSAIGGGVVGASVGLLGWALHLSTYRVPVVVVAAIGALILRSRQILPIGNRRQVPRHWARTVPVFRLYSLWGILLGSGIATLIPYSSYLLILALQLTHAVPISVAIGASFGLFRELPALLQAARQPEDRMPRVLAQLGSAVRRGNTLVIAFALALTLANA